MCVFWIQHLVLATCWPLNPTKIPEECMECVYKKFSQFCTGGIGHFRTMVGCLATYLLCKCSLSHHDLNKYLKCYWYINIFQLLRKNVLSWLDYVINVMLIRRVFIYFCFWRENWFCICHWPLPHIAKMCWFCCMIDIMLINWVLVYMRWIIRCNFVLFVLFEQSWTPATDCQHGFTTPNFPWDVCWHVLLRSTLRVHFFGKLIPVY